MGGAAGTLSRPHSGVPSMYSGQPPKQEELYDRLRKHAYTGRRGESHAYTDRQSESLVSGGGGRSDRGRLPAYTGPRGESHAYTDRQSESPISGGGGRSDRGDSQPTPAHGVSLTRTQTGRVSLRSVGAVAGQTEETPSLHRPTG